MAGGYRPPPGEGLGPLLRMIEEIQRRLSELETPTGTSMTSLVKQVQAALANLATQVQEEIEAQSYTRAQIDSKVASPGAISPSSVAASGAVSGSSGTFNAGLRSTGVYNELLTGGGAYRATWTHEDGRLGYVPSSRRFKRDIALLAANAEVLRELELVSFRYIAAVEARGDSAPVEVGMIAEQVHDLGVFWLVDYQVGLTEAGKATPVPFMPETETTPFGIRHDRIGLAALAVAQHNADRIDALEARVVALGG